MIQYDTRRYFNVRSKADRFRVLFESRVGAYSLNLSFPAVFFAKLAMPIYARSNGQPTVSVKASSAADW